MRPSSDGVPVPTDRRSTRRASGTRFAPDGEHPFVGRERELAQLVATMERLERGRGELYLLAGEAGVGKTRLADELCDVAAARDLPVLWGRCWEGAGAPAYWSWAQILRSALDTDDGQLALERLGAGATALSRIVPELAGDTEPTADGDIEHARFYLFDAVRAFFEAFVTAAPAVVVLDNAHDADQSSLLLLSFLARELRSLPLLVVATYRPLVARRRVEVASLLGAAAREGHHLPLGGLTRGGVAAFLAASGIEPVGALVTQVHDATAGNPFFVGEVAPLLTRPRTVGADGTGALPIPDGVRGAMRRRLESLAEQTVTVLQVAAVLGREFGLPLLSAVTDYDTDALLECIGEAVETGILSDSPGNPGGFQFLHTLVRETLYDDLPPGRRARLHYRAAVALRELHAEDLDAHLDSLAHHLRQAAPVGAADEALDVTVRAAERAASLLAFEQAAALYRDGLALAVRSDAVRTRRCDLLLALGEAEARGGANSAARDTFQLAVELARELGDAQRLARAALGCAGATTTPTAGMVDTTLVSLLAEARAALPDGELALRALVTARLAMERYYLGSRDERDALTREAVELARSYGDPSVLASALHARHFALWGLEDVEERLVAGSEILQVSREADDAGLAMEGHTWRIVAYLEQGDIAATDREIAQHARLADRHPQPYHRWNAAVFRAMRALLDGRFADAAVLAESARRLGERQAPGGFGLSVGPNARMMFGIQEFNRLKEEGRLGTLEGPVREFVRQHPTLPVWRCALAYLCIQVGADDEARAEFKQLAVRDFLDIPRDGNWLIAMSLLAEVCAELGDAERAAQLYDLLVPHDGRVIVIAQGAACRGAIAHYLGLLASTFGEVEAASEHFAAAATTHDRLGARALSARTRAAWARHLRAIGADQQAVAQQLKAAHTAYHELGLEDAAAALATELERLGVQRFEAPAPARSASASQPAAQPKIQLRGTRWTIAYEGVTTSLRDAKGLHYLAKLLGNPSREQHAIALEGGGLGDDVAGRPIDLAALRARFADLRAEIDEAEAFHDEERAALAQERLDALIAQTAADAGLRTGPEGRSRSERARVNVTRAIKAALRKIGANDPALGRHLETTLRTGTYCVYRPDPRVPLRWLLDLDPQAES